MSIFFITRDTDCEYFACKSTLFFPITQYPHKKTHENLQFCFLFCTFATKFKTHSNIMANSTIELSLMDPEEKQQLEYIWNLIPAEDRQGMTQADVLMVLDLMDDYLVAQGLLQEDDTDEVTYLEGEIDETEQLNYLMEQTKALGRALTSEQLQLIMDGELQYGIEQGYYEEE